jgi:serine/threonine protein kinase
MLHKRRKKNMDLKELQLNRIEHVGYGIAQAMIYLHQHCVLYRDLKPANVGFDAHGTVKLFDFDLSRRFLLDENESSSTLKQLTIGVGTPRYMSPECALAKPYGFSTDVYSYAILLWEIYTLQCPYANVNTPLEMKDRAYTGNERPSLRGIASLQLRRLLEQSWNPSPKHRPTMASIVDTLTSVISNGVNGSPLQLGKILTVRKSEK